MIDSFQGEYRWLSNFWRCDVVLDNKTYPTVEHAYQASKTLDIKERCRIAALPTPGDTKRAGRNVKLRPDWDQVKLSIMENLVRQKFTNNLILKKRLLDTGSQEIQEGNAWNDTFWGVCRGQGQNNLGKIIMKIRDELRQ